MAGVLGLDTSNYTTSAAWFDGTGGDNTGKLLEVPQGALGLRQSEALFQHVKRLPAILEDLKAADLPRVLTAIGASTRPREVEGSYMPCFLAGESQGKAMASVLEVPFYACSHQQGHIAAAAWSAGRMDLLDQPHLVWHLSGGTTELLYVVPDGAMVQATCIGGTSDISAGQLIDRTGKKLGLPFPAGKAVDELSLQARDKTHIPCKSFGLHLFFLRNREQNERIGGRAVRRRQRSAGMCCPPSFKGGNRHTASAGALSGASRPLRRRGSFQSAVAAENDKSMRSGVCGTAVFHRQCHGGSHPHLAHTQ